MGWEVNIGSLLEGGDRLMHAEDGKVLEGGVLKKALHEGEEMVWTGKLIGMCLVRPCHFSFGPHLQHVAGPAG